MNGAKKIHPEVWWEIENEYLRLTAKFPTADLPFLWERAAWYVRSLAQANTALFYATYLNIQSKYCQGHKIFYDAAHKCPACETK